MIRTIPNRTIGATRGALRVRAPLALVATLVVGAILSGDARAQGADPTTKIEGEPKLVVEEQTFDWGEILKGESLEHTFVVRNDGTAPLLIEQMKST